MTYIWNGRMADDLPKAGRANKGVMRDRRAQKRAEAEARNAATQPVTTYTGTCWHRHGVNGRICATTQARTAA